MIWLMLFACGEKTTQEDTSTQETQSQELAIDELKKSVAEAICAATIECCDTESPEGRAISFHHGIL